MSMMRKHLDFYGLAAPVAMGLTALALMITGVWSW